MDNNKQRLLDLFLNPEIPIQVFRALVVSIDGFNRCTVELLPSRLSVEGVCIVAEEDAGDWVKMVPKVDSIVLVGCIENQISDMYLLQAGEVESGQILIGKTEIAFDKDRVQVSQDKVKLQLSGNKLKVDNGSASLKEVFDDLSALLQNFKVITSQGPSTALFPDTLTALTKFKAKYPLLLQ